MKTGRFIPALLATALLLAAGPGAFAAEKLDAATLITMKRVADRYALTKTRITALLNARLHPVALPNNLPNPFYHAPELAPGEGSRGIVPAPGSESTVVPAEADITDADALAKFVSTLKIGGLTTIGDRLLLTLNTILCKEGDVIPTDRKGRTIYIKVVKITPDDLTLGLNEDQQVVHMRR